MEPQSPIRHAKHIFRVFALLILAVVGLILLRDILVPPTFGDYGHYRGGNVVQQMALPVRHGGDAACAECHAPQFSAHESGGHARVRCELCHAALAVHVADGKRVAEMPVRRNQDLCLLCHQDLPARPKAQPQIQPAQHVVDQGGEPGPEACFDCHDPHSPL